MKNILKQYIFLLLLLISSQLPAQIASKEFYLIKIYYLANKAQEARVEAFLKNAWIPTVHRTGIKNVGVFKPLETDSTYGKRIVILVSFKSLELTAKFPDLIMVDKQFNLDGKDYLEALYNDPPYQRIENILLRNMRGAPLFQPPSFSNPRGERVYELRSYESATEKIYQNKLKMFVDGDEFGLFKRLGFNAVFYADVIAGSHMPNLMYMTTFANQASRDEHWKAFVDDPQWKKLVVMPEYQHTISKNTQYFLRPTEYSDY